MASIDDVINSLRNTNLSPKGVSFQGQSLKLNTANDATIVINAINNCKDLEYLNLEGNTLGIEAAEAIAKALETQSKFKRALWKDMFTGRMKTEIPKALEYLGAGLVKAGTQLTLLDLSDNAFGPTGVLGLASFLRSTSCYTLEELRLNNNGLGITGGKLLAEALLDCYKSSKNVGKPLALRVFIAGRNRLENEGAQALAEVFKTLGSLEEIVMTQNGIYHVGISALSASFTHNRNLEVLNLNDNTIGPRGANAISEALPLLTKLKQINFGDCLLKTEGAVLLAIGLKPLKELEELIVGFNEIQIRGGLALVDAMANKNKLRTLVLEGNQFSEDGQQEIKDQLKEIGKFNCLGSLDECESEEDEEEDDVEEQDDVESEYSYDGSKDEIIEESINDDFLPEHFIPEDFLREEIIHEVANISIKACTFNDFIQNPSEENFLGLGENRNKIVLDVVKNDMDSFLEIIIPTLMKISGLSASNQEHVAEYAFGCSVLLYDQLFAWTDIYNTESLANNALLVHLGLIKSEDKNFKPTWNIKGCLNVLEQMQHGGYVPKSTKDSLRLFLSRDMDKNTDLIESKKNLMKALG